MPVLNRQDFADSQFVRDIERSAIDEFNRENPYEQTFYNDVAGFVAAVNWKEDGHWLAVLFGIQLMYFLLVVCFRRVEIIQLGVFVTICGLILASEYVNQFLHDHWREFSTQDYFDEHGVFFSVVFSGPLLAIGFLQLVLVLCYVKNLLVSVKRAELREKGKAASKKAEKGKVADNKKRR